MSIQVRKKGKVTIVEFSGKLTIDKTGAMRESVERLIDEGHRLFVFDMLQVPWLDSVGIGQTVGCYRRAKDAGGTVKLALKGKAHSIFTYVELDRAFEIFDDLEEALASFAA